MVRGSSALIVNVTIEVPLRPVYHAEPDKINTITGHEPDTRATRSTLSSTVVQAEPLPLATVRKRRLLSQRGLAARAQVALSTVYLLEAGKTGRVTFKVMRALSEALGVPPESIVEFRRVIQPD